MTSLIRVLSLSSRPFLEDLTPILQDTGQAGREKKSTDLSSKESTHSNDTQDVEHGRAHNRPYTDISVGDEHTCNKREMMAEPDSVESWEPVPSMPESN